MTSRLNVKVPFLSFPLCFRNAVEHLLRPKLGAVPSLRQIEKDEGSAVGQDD